MFDDFVGEAQVHVRLFAQAMDRADLVATPGQSGDVRGQRAGAGLQAALRQRTRRESAVHLAQLFDGVENLAFVEQGLDLRRQGFAVVRDRGCFFSRNRCRQSGRGFLLPGQRLRLSRFNLR